MTPACEGVRSNSVESFILSNDDNTPVDVSDFLALYRFPKLRRLELNNCKISSWDFLTSRTAVLTTLILHLNYPSSTPTTSQLLSILDSNPTLRKVSLSRCAIPEDGGGESPYRVLLHHLRDLELTGGFRHVIGLLRRLDHPTNVYMDITLCDGAVPDITRIVGPYFRDYLSHRDRSRNGLALYVSRFKNQNTLHVGDLGGADLSTPVWMQISPFVSITVEMDRTTQGISGKWFLDLIAHLPLDDIISFRSWDEPAFMEDVPAQFQNLRALESGSIPLSAVFPEPNPDENKRLPPSLQHIILRRPDVDGGDWSPLTTFLACRASTANRLDSLTIVGSHMCPRVEGHVRSMVRELRGSRPSQGCPFGTCPEE